MAEHTDPAAPETGTPGFSTGTFARVTGTVQGVNYRASARRRAEDLGLTGWVRNTGDDAVELLIGGEDPAVDALLKWCRSGPKRARVEEVQTREATPKELGALPAGGFEIRR